jgi:hypothetical protein
MNKHVMTWLASLVLMLGLAAGLALDLGRGTAAALSSMPTAPCSDPTGMRSVGLNLLTVSEEPPRISLAAFKALYDDPATRPLILDVRDPDTYAAGHVPGAISFPEADVDARVGELPKDKLIVAYCQ